MSFALTAGLAALYPVTGVIPGIFDEAALSFIITGVAIYETGIFISKMLNQNKIATVEPLVDEIPILINKTLTEDLSDRSQYVTSISNSHTLLDTSTVIETSTQTSAQVSSSEQVAVNNVCPPSWCISSNPPVITDKVLRAVALLAELKIAWDLFQITKPSFVLEESDDSEV